MMHKILSNTVTLIDGSLSTELENLNYSFQESPFWTGKAVIYDPEIIKQVHINFLKSRSKIITTGSYQLNIDNLTRKLNISKEKALEIIKKSVKIAREAQIELNLQETTLVAGSVGPYGACECDGSEYTGAYLDSKITYDELIEWHRPRIEALIESGVDFIAIETIPSIREAEAICNILEKHPNANAWLSFTCKDDSSLCYGDKFCDAYEKFKNNSQLIAIGINCTSPFYVTNLLKNLKEHNKPLIVYPNDGSVWNAQERRFMENNESFIEIFKREIPKWIEYGVKFIGGCCRIDSNDILRINELLNMYAS